MKKRQRRKGDAAQLEMTPMIDVVFQLLIFFIVTLKQEDILAQLDVTRPGTENTQPTDEEPPPLFTITVFKDGYLLKGQLVSAKELERQLSRMATFSTTFAVIIKCTSDSQHSNLVQVLDLCSKAGLKNLSVFSM